MGTVLEDVTSETIDAEHVARRVEDCAGRVTGLYTAIGDWLQNGWEAHRGVPVVMHEAMMRKFDVAAKRRMWWRGGWGDRCSICRSPSLWRCPSPGRMPAIVVATGPPPRPRFQKGLRLRCTMTCAFPG